MTYNDDVEDAVEPLRLRLARIEALVIDMLDVIAVLSQAELPETATQAREMRDSLIRVLYDND